VCELKTPIHGYFNLFRKATLIFLQKIALSIYCNIALSFYRNIACKNRSSDEGLKDTFDEVAIHTCEKLFS
jgi:hypothetical protein